MGGQVWKPKIDQQQTEEQNSTSRTTTIFYLGIEIMVKSFPEELQNNCRTIQKG